MKPPANDEKHPDDLALCCTFCGCARYYILHRDGLNWLRCVRCDADMTMEAFGG